MRKWMNLFERSGFYEPPREQIIQYMISHLSQGMYWDKDARTPDGQPMNDDNAADMAHTWNDVGRYTDLGEHDPNDPDFIDQPAFQAKLLKWANERFDEVTAKIEQIPMDNGRFAVSRCIRVSDGWKPTDGLGIYWTFDYDGADISGAPWGAKNEGQDIWMHGHASPHDVDWFHTYLANMDWYSGDQEHELRLKKGAYVMLDRFEDGEGKTLEIGRPYRA